MTAGALVALAVLEAVLALIAALTGAGAVPVVLLAGSALVAAWSAWKLRRHGVRR